MQSVDLLGVGNANTRGRQQGPHHIALALQLSSALCQVLGDGCVAHIPPAPQACKCLIVSQCCHELCSGSNSGAAYHIIKHKHV